MGPQHAVPGDERADSLFQPLDVHPAWRPVPDRTLLVATATDLTTTPLGER